MEITRDQVLVVPAPGAPGRLPFWHGDSVGRPAELGAAVGAFVREVDERDRRGDGTAVQLARDHGLDENAAQNLLRYVADQREATGRVPTDRTLVLEKFRDELGDWRVVLHSPYGAQVHAAWALAVAARITERFGVDAQVMGSDDGIVARLPDTAARWDDPFGFEDPPGGQDSTTPRSATGGDLLDVLAEIVSIDPEEVEALVTGQLGGSALFAARFRECAARALLLPRRRPDKRQPLWQQRQRAAQLLEVAAQYPNFPIVLETVRECLQDVFDLPGLVDLLRQVRAGRVRIVEVSTTHASPFASALMFGYVAAFLYEGDSPLAERRSAALSLDPQLLAEVLGRADAASLADLLDPAAVLATYRQLQWLTPERQVRDAEHLTDLLRSLGPLTGPDIRARTDPATTDADLAAWIGDLKTTRRIVAVRVGGRDCYAVVEDAARLRDALGVPLPVGIPAALLQATPDPLTGLVARYARHQVGFTAEMVARRFGLGVTVAARTLTDLVAAGRLTAATVVPAECAHLLTEDTTTSENTTALDDTTALEDTTRPVGPAGARPGVEQEAIPTGLPAATQFCDTEVLRRLKRRSLAALRADVEPVPQSALGAFNAAWQHVATTTGHRLSGIDGLAEVVEQLAGVAIPASALESLVLPARVRDYSPAWLDELTTSGEVLWAGHGSLPGEDGWISLHPRPTAHLTLPAADVSALTESQAALLAQLSGGGAFFAAELAARLDGAGAASLDADLWALLWAGAVTTDTLAGLRARLGTGRTAHRSRRGPGRARYARTGRPGWRRGLTASATRTNPAAAGARLPAELAGRWSALPAAEADPTLRTAAWAEILLDRYGVLTRGALSAEQVPGGFAAVYKALSVMEETGRVRRGYFVERLGAAQFATAGAVDRLRAVGDAVTRAAEDPHGAAPPRAAALAAADPANPYGAALGWPPVAEGTHRPGRRAGALVVLAGGQLLAYLERGGKTLLTWTEDPAMVRAAAESVARAVHGGAVGRLTVARINGQPALSTSDPARDALLAAGFVAAPSGLRLAPGRTVPATD
ncbi:MAG: hypothetical protein CSA58_05215 [Micrococcales bacterium]|nr:MAG: hypothetical protein CSA58_05215 [Micrococcales bacterium]